MAMTETRPDPAETQLAAAGAPAGAGPSEPSRPLPQGGLTGMFGTGDHLVLGRLWIGVSICFLLVSGIAGALLGIERFDTTHYDVLDGKNYAQTLSLHSVSGIFLFLLPMILGLRTSVVARQVRAATFIPMSTLNAGIELETNMKSTPLQFSPTSLYYRV